MSDTRVMTGSDRSEPIRLLEIIGNAMTGGMETYAHNLIANLPGGEFSVSCLCPHESAYTASLRALGSRVYVTPIRDDPMWRAIEMTAEIVRQNRVDLIHANMANAHTLAGIVSGLTGVPAVATIHSRMLCVQELSVARLTRTHLITVCQEARNQALATGLADDLVTLIPNGVDLGRFHPDRDGAAFRQSIGVDPEALLVGFVGRLSWEKGPDKFIQVAGRIRQELPHVQFVMVGRGPAESEIHHLIERLDLRDNVRLAGARTDMDSVYPALDLFVQTSRSEAMPLALLESMACGVPSLAISVGGVAEVVESETTGLLISPGEWPGVSSRYPGDWEGIACGAIDLLRWPDGLKNMGLAARRRVEAHFSLDRSVGETAALFRKLASPRATVALPQITGAKTMANGRARLDAFGGRRPRLSAVQPSGER